MDDPRHVDQHRLGNSEERESPMFVPQEDEDTSLAAFEGSERATSSPVVQNPISQERPGPNSNDVVDLTLLVEANTAMDQANAPKDNYGGQGQDGFEFEEGIGEENSEENGEDPGEEDAEEPDEEDAEEPGNDEDTGGKRDYDQPRPRGRCPDGCNQLLRIMAKRIKKKDRSIDIRNKKIKSQREVIRCLERILRQHGLQQDGTTGRPQERARRDGGGRSSEPTWPGMLRQHLTTNDPPYEKVWKQSQRELNMPVNPGTVHPNIRLIPRDADQLLDGNSRQSSPVVSEALLPGQGNMRISFDDLPSEVLLRILQYLLWFDGALVHCFSRLDPYVVPDHFPDAQELGETRTGVRGRFFISAEKRVPVSLTYDTVDPNKVLAPLSVCRRWAWYGCHIFYGRNTFAFSSLGEWDRFCNGIKAARVQRIQNVELTWVGGKCLSFDTSSTRGKRMNMRTLSLTWFCDTSSLKTLVIHITETSKDYIRRRYEPTSAKLYMKGKTAGQPNARLTRALRCCHGMDYIYQLRGLYWLHVYDLEKTVSTMERHSVRDSSFVIDLERVVTQKKVPLRAENSSLPKLKHLFPEGGWEPLSVDLKLITEVYSEATGYKPRDNDLDNDTTSSRGTSSPSPSPEGSDDGSSDDGSDGSESSGPGPGLPTPPASTGRHMRRGATPAPARQGADFRVPRARSEGGLVSHVSEDILQRVAIVIDDDEDEIQEIPRPAQRRSTRSSGLFVTPNPSEALGATSNGRQTVDLTAEPEPDPLARLRSRGTADSGGLFVTPNPSEALGTPSNGRQTVDLTAEPEPDPLARLRSRGTTDSGGLFVRQSHSEPNNSPAPPSRGASVQIDLTHSDDEDETDARTKASHTPVHVGESHGVKRPRSSSTAVSEPANSHKRQMTEVHINLQGP
ncbi:hypothetical protein VMCG_03052 [Cytospora schulzeri]|uniref:Uncharacterized protein n=1 Tax=Cytospora schulzeri TaxID=448051 RepID=A0A423WY03_9PEZI|nr:hypothetical protein VMCG_03052 [Valsa malicola]